MVRSFLLLSAFAHALISNAQIPNGDFESWSSDNGYDQPAGWNSFNGFTQPYGVFTCFEGTPGHTGASHLRLVTQNIPGLTILGGIAVSGAVGASVDGFPYAQRPDELLGWWQYSASDPDVDNGLVTVELTRWNALTEQRETIGLGQAVTPGNTSGWELFSAPIDYFTVDYPDTAIISFTSNGGGVPQIGSTLLVDDLVFSTSTEVREVTTAPDVLIVDGSSVLATQAIAELALMGMDGRVLFHAGAVAHGERMDLHGVPTGAYVFRARTTDGSWHCQRCVLQLR